MKKIITILFVAFIIFITGFLLLKKTPQSADLSDMVLANNSLIARFETDIPEKQTKPTGPVKLSNDTGSSSILLPTGELLFYNPLNGQIRSIAVEESLRGNVVGSSPAYQLKSNLKNLSWSKDFNSLLAENIDGYVFFDLKNNQSKKLNQNFKKIIFSNSSLNFSGSDVAYLYLPTDLDRGGIFIGNLQEKTEKNIFKTRSDNWQIAQLSEKEIALWTKSDIYSINTVSGDLEKILDNIAINKTLWSPNGTNLLFSNNKGTFILNMQNKTPIKLINDVNLPDCIWNYTGSLIYCSTSETFISLDPLKPENNAKILAQNPFGPYVDNLKIDPLNQYLVFRETNTGKFYGLYINH
jgi:hypothetical protein